MGIEIERKFLANQAPFHEWGEGIDLTQGYLARGLHATARVRIAGRQGFITIKGKTTGISRQEFEYEIPVDEAEALLSLCEGGIISKKRWKIPYEGHVWEVDLFFGENKGLCLAEIELTSEEEAFKKPVWLGQEVSHDPRYFNGALSKKPFNTW